MICAQRYFAGMAETLAIREDGRVPLSALLPVEAELLNISLQAGRVKINAEGFQLFRVMAAVHRASKQTNQGDEADRVHVAFINNSPVELTYIESQDI